MTKPRPFELKTELRGQAYQDWLSEHLIEEQQKENEERHFHSHPVPHYEPFIPKKSTKPLTQHHPIPLTADIRVEKRREFDRHIKERGEAEMLQCIEQAELRSRSEKREIRALRKELVHKAQPIKRYAPLIIRPSERPLTTPISPPLLTLIRTGKRINK